MIRCRYFGEAAAAAPPPPREAWAAPCPCEEKEEEEEECCLICMEEARPGEPLMRSPLEVTCNCAYKIHSACMAKSVVSYGPRFAQAHA